MNAITNLTVHTSRDSANAGTIPGCKLFEVTKRMPSRYAGVWVSTAVIPSTVDVPEQFRAVVDAAITGAIERIIDKRVFSGEYVPTWIAGDALTQDSIMEMLASNATLWLSKDELTAGWNASQTFIGFKAKMMSINDPAQRKAYGRALDAFADDINKLSAKSVKSITPATAEKMLAKLNTADLSSKWGEFVAMRLGKIMNMEEPAEVDLDSL